MKETKVFKINGMNLELPLFEAGDRVKPTDKSTTAIGATGTVEGTRAGGLFVDVIWDQPTYPCLTGGKVELGSGRMVDGLILIENSNVLCRDCLGEVEDKDGNFELELCNSCNESLLKEEGLI